MKDMFSTTLESLVPSEGSILSSLESKYIDSEFDDCDHAELAEILASEQLSQTILISKMEDDESDVVSTEGNKEKIAAKIKEAVKEIFDAIIRSIKVTFARIKLYITKGGKRYTKVYNDVKPAYSDMIKSSYQLKVPTFGKHEKLNVLEVFDKLVDGAIATIEHILKGFKTSVKYDHYTDSKRISAGMSADVYKFVMEYTDGLIEKWGTDSLRKGFEGGVKLVSFKEYEYSHGCSIENMKDTKSTYSDYKKLLNVIKGLDNTRHIAMQACSGSSGNSELSVACKYLMKLSSTLSQSALYLIGTHGKIMATTERFYKGHESTSNPVKKTDDNTDTVDVDTEPADKSKLDSKNRI